MFSRKALIALVCLTASLGVAYASGVSPTDESGTPAKAPITLRLWGGIQPEYGYDAVVANFNKEFRDKGVQLEYVRYVNDNNGNLQLDTYLASGGQVDLFVGYGGLSRFRPRVESNLLMDLTDLLKEKSFDAYKEIGEVNVRTWMVNDRIYTLPAVFGNGAFWFANVDRFKEAGVPLPLRGWTQAEFREALKKLTKGEGINKQYGMWWGINWNRAYANAMIQDMLGKYTRYKNDQMTETNFDHPLFAQGLQLIVDTMRTDKTAIPLEDEVGDKIDFAKAFISGKAAIAVDQVQVRIVKDTKAYPHDFVTAMIPAPVPGKEFMDRWNHDVGAGGGSDYVCISAKTQYPKEALDAFIWYLKGGSYPLAKGGRLPLWSGVDRNLVADALLEGADAVFVRESVLNYLGSINANRAFSSLSGPASPQIEKVWAEEMDAALYGKKTVSQAVKDAKARADDLIAKLKK
jgi:multiple sugar transport system substrate-binding protein